MTQKLAHRLMFAILLICQLSVCLAAEPPNRTPLWYAEKESHTEIVELLRKPR